MTAKTFSNGRLLHAIDYDDGMEVFERHGRRGQLLFHAAEDGVEPELMVSWADTEKDEL